MSTPRGRAGSVEMDMSKGEQLLVAATEGDIVLVNRLLLSDTDVNYRNKYGYTALIKACRMKRIEVAKLLIASGADVNAASENGWTALIEAARVGSVELVQLLLKKDASIESTNKMGWTALIEACRNAHFDAIKTLVEVGHSNVSHRDRDGFTAKEHTSRALGNIRDYLKRMWRKQQEEAHREGREYGTPTTPQTGVETKQTNDEKLVDAASRGELDTVESFRKMGASVNAVNRNGRYSALTLACRNQQIEMAKYLVEHGATLDYRSETGWTALIEAARVGNETLVTYLLSKKASVNLGNDFGWPPLIEACRNAHYEVVEILLNNGADVKLLDCDGETALEHTNHPWIRALIIDNKIGGADGGPRAVLSSAVRSTKSLPKDERRRKIVATVDQLRAKFKGRYEGSLEYSLFEVLVQLLEADLIEAVMDDEAFQSAILQSKSNIFHSMVQLTPPEDDDRKHWDDWMQPASKLVACMDVIRRGLFGDDRRSSFWFVNFTNQANGGSAMLQCAANYCKSVERSARDNFPAKRLSDNSKYYFHILKYLLSIGSRVNDKDGNRSTVLHYLLRPLIEMKSVTMTNPLDELITNFNTIWAAYKDKQGSAGFKQETLNVVDSNERTVICYVVMMHEHPNREELIMSLLNKGAHYPTSTKIDLGQEQARLFGFIQGFMSEPDTAWYVMRNAVKFQDYNMVQQVMSRKLPFLMVRPLGADPLVKPPGMNTPKLPRGGTTTSIRDDEKSTPKAGLRRLQTLSPSESISTTRVLGPDVDCCDMEECLLHMAVETEHEQIFDDLLAYSSQTAQPWSQEIPLLYPWPNEDPSNPLTWRDPYGRTTFHVIANKKAQLPSAANASFFAKLLKTDIHAVVTQPDNYGWTAVHYAAYHNKLEIINMLVTANIDLDNPTLGDDEHNRQYTALHLSAMQANWSVALALLKADVTVDVIDKDGCTPLARAMLSRQSVSNRLRSLQHPEHHDHDHAAPADQHTSIPVHQDEQPPLPPFPGSPTSDSRDDLLDQGESKGDDSGVRRASTQIQMTPMPGVHRSSTMISGGDTHRMTVAEQFALDQQRQFAAFAAEGGVDEESRAPQTEEELLQTRKEMYSLTIEALLDFNASIAAASAKSGKSLYELMNVAEKWYVLSSEIQDIAKAEFVLEDEYFDVLANPASSLEARRQKKDDWGLQLKVLANRRNKLFLDKEAQMVINQYYDEKIRKRHFMKLLRYCLFLALLTWLGIFMTTRDTTSAYFMQSGYYAKISSNGFFDDTVGPTERYPIDTKSFDTIDADYDDFYQWCHNLLPDALLSSPPSWVPGADPNIHNETVTPVSVLNWNNIILGRARFRQIRSSIRKCTVSDGFEDIVVKQSGGLCYDVNEETASFGPGGKFQHFSEDELDGVPIWGQIFSLSGGGHVVHLPNLRNSSQAEMQNFCLGLAADNFIDGATRAVFFEMVIMNPSEHHFAVASLLLEFSRTGAIVSSSDINVSRLFRYFQNSDDHYYFALEVVVGLMVLMHIYSELLQMKSSRNCAYLRSVYNWTDLMIVLGGPTIAGLEIAGWLLEKQVEWDNPDKYPAVMRIARIYYAQRYIFCLLILTSWFKLFDYLSVFKEFYRLIIIIETSAANLSYIFGVFIIVLIGFTSAEYVAYGFKNVTSKTWTWGFLNRLLGIFSGNTIQFDHTSVDRILGMFFNIIFVLIFSMLLLNLIVAMLTAGFDAALEETSDVMARRQYDKLHSEGLTKEKRTKRQPAADDDKKKKKKDDSELTEKLDEVFLQKCDNCCTRMDDFIDRRILRVLRTRNLEKRRKRLMGNTPVNPNATTFNASAV